MLPYSIYTNTDNVKMQSIKYKVQTKNINTNTKYKVEQGDFLSGEQEIDKSKIFQKGFNHIYIQKTLIKRYISYDSDETKIRLPFYISCFFNILAYI